LDIENSPQKAILKDVAAYYSSKLAQHGTAPKGVDWNSKESQEVRFEQLCKVIDSSRAFSINDLGCGYGALVDYLRGRNWNFSYAGYDVSESMIGAAQIRLPESETTHFEVAAEPSRHADYGVASGIFNVRLDHSDEEWLSFIHSTLDILNRTSKRGFSFNCLTSYSDKDKMRADLYYANSLDLFDLCKTKYSKNVSLLHDYDLYEFTILVRK